LPSKVIDLEAHLIACFHTHESWSNTGIYARMKALPLNPIIIPSRQAHSQIGNTRANQKFKQWGIKSDFRLYHIWA